MTEAETIFERARQAALELVPLATPQRITQVVAEVTPKLADLFARQGVFDNMSETVDPQRVIASIAMMYGSVYDYRSFHSLVIAASPIHIYPIFVENIASPWEKTTSGVDRFTQVAIRMKHGGLTEEDMPYIEDRRILEATMYAKGPGRSNESTDDFYRQVPVYPGCMMKSIFDASASPENFVRWVFPDKQEVRYIGELIPQKRIS